MKRLAAFSKTDTSGVVNDAFDEATGQPLIDQWSQYVRYEVRVSESEYNYYVTNSYYDADSQIVAVQQNRFVGFPKGNQTIPGLPAWSQFGATEIKASWRVFPDNATAAEKSRYFRTKAILVDSYGNCSDTAEVGLIGLHILRLTPSTGATWYWASFEQVDNLSLQPQFGGTLPAHPNFNTNPPVMYGDSGYSYKPAPIKYGQPLPAPKPVGVSAPPFRSTDPLLDSINMAYNKMLAGTPFQFYQMIGTVNPPYAGQTNPTIDSVPGGTYPSVTVNAAQLANSTMETYGVKSNCVSCHMFGYPQLPPNYPTPYSSSLQVFTFLPGLAESSGAAAKKLKK